jgi:heme exporter protein A
MMDMNSGFAIDAQGIARRFGARWVLRGVTLQVRPGEVVGLLGANGSGKSTLLRILATLLSPSAGEATVGGADIKKDPDGVRNQIGYLAHAAGLYDDLSARENLEFAAEMHGLQSPNLDAALDRVGLAHVADERVRGFSAGMQRRLALARLVLGKPRVLLLDEPYSNLDTAGIALMNELIRESVRGGGAALVVVHELAPVVGILDRTIGIRDGRVAMESSVEASLIAAAAAGGR